MNTREAIQRLSDEFQIPEMHALRIIRELEPHILFRIKDAEVKTAQKESLKVEQNR